VVKQAPAVRHSGRLRVRGKRFAIIASRFNSSLTRALVAGAADTLRRAGVSDRRIRVVWVPGAFELPVIARQLAGKHPRPSAIIAVGALIRGETTQHEVIANAAAQGLASVSVDTGIPVTFGVIVAETPAQAAARAGGSAGHRGREAAQAALAVLECIEQLNHH
jgi:6,7-dimethyl-8-ribityllumazine synthase